MSDRTFKSAVLDWQGKIGLPEFDKIADTDFEPAFERALEDHNGEIEAIAGNADDPDFHNVIGELERAGKPLSHVSALFWNRAGAHTNDAIRELERKIAPVLSRHYSQIAQNKELFSRIRSIWETVDKLELDTEAFRVLERYWKNFVKSGALLDDEAQKRLAEINEQLATLGTRFGQNVLSDEAEWTMLLEKEEDLKGIPGFLRDAMREAAREHGHEEGYAVTLSRSVIEPFLKFSERRDLRETAFAAWTTRGEGKHDNLSIVSRILSLRWEKATLLGYENYAAVKLDDTMAKEPDAVRDLLLPVWEKAIIRADEEAEALSKIIAEEGHNHVLEPWDWRHYAEKRRTQEFDFSESELKPYFVLERMIEAAFETANRLFGISFRPLADFTAWHPDVRTFEVLNRDGSLRGIFFGDYFARPSKRSGAWMSALQTSHKLDGGQLPFICNVMNFAKSASGEPALLSLDDARTLFHEFGHALHGLLSDVTWPSVSGTSVSRDFVELPSQLFEHWLTVPDILNRYALHCETGEPMPKALLDKVLAAQTFNSGFQTVEYTACALVDMAYHTAQQIDDPAAFEARTLEQLKMPRAITMRHRTPHFLHIFSGDGYSAGYYSYMWSEVLDADAFHAFLETGDPFNSEIAKKLHDHIYAVGGSVDPEATYKAFRGKLPSPDAMMKERGLA